MVQLHSHTPERDARATIPAPTPRPRHRHVWAKRAAMAVVAMAALASVLFTSTTAWAASIQAYFLFTLGETAAESTVASWSIGVDPVQTWRPKSLSFSGAVGITGEGTAETPYDLDFSKGSLAYLPPAQLNNNEDHSDGGLFNTKSNAAITILPKSDSTAGKYLKVKSFEAAPASAKIKGEKDRLVDGDGFFNSKGNLLAIQKSNVIIENNFKLTNETPSDLKDANGNVKTIKCGVVSVDETSSLTLRGFESSADAYLVIHGRITNNGTLTIEGVGNKHTGATLSAGVENENVSILNYGTLNIGGGTVKNDIVVKGGEVNITAGTIDGNIKVEGGTVKISGDARVNGKVTVSGGNLEVSAGTFKHLVDPQYVGAAKYLTVSGSSARDRLYTYSASPLPDLAGYCVELDHSSAATGVIMFSAGFKASVSEASDKISTQLTGLMPGEKLPTLPTRGDVFWMVFYGPEGTYSANISKGGEAIWSSTQNVTVGKDGEPGFGLIWYSLDEASKTSDLAVDTYSIQLNGQNGTTASKSIPLSSVTYQIDDGTMSNMPGTTYYQAGDVVKPTGEIPVSAKGYTFANAWELDGGYDYVIPDTPTAMTMKPVWTQSTPEISLSATGDLSDIEAGTVQQLSATVANTVADSHTGTLTVKFTLPGNISLEKGALSVKTSGARDGVVDVSDEGFTVTFGDLAGNEAVTVTYDVLIAREAETSSYTVGVSADPATGEDKTAQTTISVYALPKLALTMNPSSVDSIYAGESLPITLTVENTAAGSHETSATINVTLPANLSVDGGNGGVEVKKDGAAVEDANAATSGDGFSVSLPSIAHGEKFTIAFTAKIDKAAPTGDVKLLATATPNTGFAASIDPTIHVIGLPVLEVAEASDTLLMGEAQELTTTITNITPESSTDQATVTVVLPDDIKLDGEATSAVKTPDVSTQSVSSTGNGFTLTVDDVANGKPLVINYRVKGDTGVEDGDRDIHISVTVARGTGISEAVHNVFLAKGPRLVLEADPVIYAQIGKENVLHYTIRNVVPKSNTGAVSFLIKFPAFTVDGKSGTGWNITFDDMKATCGNQTVTVTSPASQCVQVKVTEGITQEDPLEISFKLNLPEGLTSVDQIKVNGKQADRVNSTITKSGGLGDAWSTTEGTIPLVFVDKPVLTTNTIGTTPVLQGSEASFTATIKNTVEHSTTGKTNIVFTVPNGLTLSADEAEGVKVSAEADTTTVTVDDIASNDPLNLNLRVSANKDAEAGEKSINYTATPTYGSVVTGSATVNVERLASLEIVPAEMTSIQQGTEATITTTIKNATVPDTPSGKAEISFKLPQGVTLAGEGVSKVECSNGEATQTNDGFEVSAEFIASASPTTVTYTVSAADNAPVSSAANIEISAKAEKSELTTGTQTLAITQKPSITISSLPATLQEDDVATPIVTIKNNVSGSSTGEFTAEFTLPDGVALKGDPSTAVHISGVGGTCVTSSEGGNGFVVKAKDLPGDATLTISSDVATSLAEPTTCTIDVKASAANPVAGVLSSKLPLQIVQKPKLEVRSENGEVLTLQKGAQSLDLHLSVENMVEDSSTGETVIAVKLPKGVQLTQQAVAGVKATYGTKENSETKQAADTEDGFTITLPKLEKGKVLDATFSIQANEVASNEDNTITITATPEKGTGDSASISLQIIDTPQLSIDVEDDADRDDAGSLFQQGRTQQVSATIANSSVGSTTGTTTLTVTLPQGLSFEGDPELSGAKDATSEFDGSDKRKLVVKVSDIPEGEPLQVDFAVKVADNASADPKGGANKGAIAFTLDPTYAAEDTYSASLPYTIIAKPSIQITTNGATLQQGKSAQISATIENTTEKSRTGKTEIAFSLPPGVRLSGGASSVVATCGEERLEPTLTESGFALELDELAPKTPVSATFTVTADEGASLGANKVMEVLVTPELCDVATARAAITVTTNGRLSIAADGATIKPGLATRLSATVSNATVGSHPGPVTVTFTLPKGVELDGNVATAVKAAQGSRTITPKATASGFQVTVSDLTVDSELSVGYTVRVPEDAESGTRAVTIVAKPADASLVTSSASAQITIPEPEPVAPSAAEIATPSAEDVADLYESLEKATGGVVTIEAPKASVAEGEREAEVEWVVRIDADAEGEPEEGEGPTEPTEPLSAETIGEQVVSSIFASAKATFERASSSFAQSYDDPEIVLEDLGHASAEDIASFARRCTEAILAKARKADAGDTAVAIEATEGAEAQIQATPTMQAEPASSDALIGKKLTILIVTNEGTPDESLVTYTFAFEAGRAEAPKDPSEAPEAPGEGEATVYRLYNRWTGAHLLTTDEAEYEARGADGWTKEGARYVLPEKSSVEVRRLYNAYNGEHLYTTSKDEVDELTPLGWIDEGVKLYGAEGEGTIPVYRCYNPYVKTGTHLWTEDEAEYEGCGTAGWKQEGEMWRAIRPIEN